jgi:hypothetical protein
MRRFVAISAIGAAAAVVAIVVTTLSPPDLVARPEAASAAGYLEETATTIREQDTSRVLETTLTTEELLLLGGPGTTEEAPFGLIRSGAVGAVLTETKDVFTTTAGIETMTTTTRFHAREVYGDRSQVEQAWNRCYGGTSVGDLNTSVEPPPEHVIDVVLSPPILPVPFEGYPTDPRAFLDAWGSGTDDEPYSSSPPSVGELMMGELAGSVQIYLAPADYRATFLEALALADGIAIEDDSSETKILALETEFTRYRLAINPGTGEIQSAEFFTKKFVPDWANPEIRTDVGSAPFVSDDIPDYAVRATTTVLG